MTDYSWLTVFRGSGLLHSHSSLGISLPWLLSSPLMVCCRRLLTWPLSSPLLDSFWRLVDLVFHLTALPLPLIRWGSCRPLISLLVDICWHLVVVVFVLAGIPLPCPLLGFLLILLLNSPLINVVKACCRFLLLVASLSLRLHRSLTCCHQFAQICLAVGGLSVCAVLHLLGCRYCNLNNLIKPL